LSKRKAWLGLWEAAHLVSRTLGISLGATRPVLCMAGASGDVQSICNFGSGPIDLPAHKWGDEIDLENEILTGSDGVHKYSAVKMNAKDLEYWLEQNVSWLRQDQSTPPPLSKSDGEQASLPKLRAEKRSAPLSRRRGPRPRKFQQAVDMMRQKIATGELTLDELKEMREKELAHDFGASRYTCRKARDAVLGTSPMICRN
jgi:hypothetical protein